MTHRFFPRDEYFMRLALREAERSLEHDDVPVGCVIAHDGFNDLVFGLLSDPWLLGEHSIAYQPQFELWAQRLHDAPGDRLTHHEQPFAILNLPHAAPVGLPHIVCR